MLGLTGASDVHIDCLQLADADARYLQSSPEYYMKRLLAAGIGSLYYLGKAFRQGELGQRHHPEFTMLEWYRVDWDEHRLMGEVFDLLVEVGAADSAEGYSKKSYRELFQTETGIDPHGGELNTLRALAGQLADRDCSQDDRATCLDLIFSLRIEPSLPNGILFVHDYPACQAALADISVDACGATIARRFEVFYDRMELCNGYYELADAAELSKRFEQDNIQRHGLGKPTVPLDRKLLGAIEAGLPPCAGVALGVDRLLMQMLGARNIGEVLIFLDI